MNDQKRKVIEEYWLKKLSGELPKISLPLISDFKKELTPEIANYEIQLSDQIASNLNRISKGSDIALFILVLSGLNIVLNKYTGVDDLVIGSMTPKKDANTSELLLLRNQISIKLTIKEILNTTKKMVLEAFNYGEYSFEEIYNKLKSLYDQNFELEIFNIALLYDKLHDTNDFPIKFDIVFILSSKGEKLSLDVRYNSVLYSEDIIRYFCKNLLNIFENLSAYLDQEISMLEMVSREEKEKLLEFNDTKIEYLKTKTIHELFEEQVENRPDDIALIFEEESLTYKELNEKSNQLAHILRDKGVQADNIIGIMVKRSLEMIVGILGVLKAGGAYLPVDPTYPQERIKYMIEDSGVNILLTHHDVSNLDKLEFMGESIDITDKSLSDCNKTKLENIASPNNLAYIIYTSGSTGKPKGVMIEHRNVLNFIKGISSKIDFSSSKTILALTTISFDIFVLETLVPLAKGVKIVIASEDQQNNLELLQELLITHAINMLQLTPSRLKLLINNSDDLSCFSGIEELMVGGEAFPEHLSTTLTKNFNGRIFNLYGPTEATVWSTLQEVVDWREINIGTPIANTQIYILNENQKINPIGVNGELCIAGDGLARGYLNNPELTQEKFIIKDGKKLYRTGDLARWNANGEIDFLGRIDHQVKIRGFRIELGEIENILLSHDDIDAVVVNALENTNGDNSLAAYYISHKAFTISDFRDHLLQNLPEYMVPSYFVKLEKIPLTQNGKVNRKALPNPDVNVEQNYVAPRDQLEEKIVEIWSEVLGVDYDSIGIDTNFFELGGHSLSAFQIISKIQKFINVMITIPNFFGSPTIRQLVLVIKVAEKNEFNDLEKVEEKEYYPISYNQRRLWILYQLDPESPAYNLPGRMTLKSQVNEEWIKKALIKIMDRHESFRTGFKTINGELVQFIMPTNVIELPVEIIDISSLSANEKQQKREEIFAKVAKTIFDLSTPPLFTSVLLKLDKESYEFIFNMHHIISDGWSMEILQREFSYYCEGYSRGNEVELPPVVYQYKDFAVWHNKQLNNQKIKEKSHQFWKEKLESGFPLLDLPKDNLRTLEQSKKSSGYRCVVNKEVKDRLRKIASENNTTLFMVMFSGFNALLSYLSGQQEVVSGIASAGRDHISLQNIVGYFTNSLIQKTKVDYNESFRELLSRVDQETQGTFQHQSYPLELVLDDLKMRFPEISVLFNMLNMIDSANEELDSLDSYHIAKLQDGKFELELYVIEYKNGIEINWSYRNLLFKLETMEYIVGEYLKLLNEVSLDIGKQISEYNIFALRDIEIKGNQIEPTNLYEEFNGDYQSIVGRFNEQVAKYPDQIAVKTYNRILTYNELNLLSNQIGRMILDESKSTSNGIALLFEHDTEMIAGIFGVLKSGQYYIPLDPTYPIKRLTYMLKDSAAKMILTNDANIHLAKKLIREVENDITIININAIESISDKNLNIDIDIDIDPNDLAYILYTSGSTGTPKGVIQNHKNVLHFIKVYTNNLHIDSIDRLTLLSSYCFDAAVMDIYGALLNGATLYPYNLKDGVLSSFAKWLQDEKITIYHSIPTVYRYFIDELTGEEELSDLRLIVLGGEVVNRRDVEKYKEHFSDNCLFINGLGPTESTVTLQYFIDKQKDLGSKTVPVGFPVDETEVYLLDESSQEARVFGIGELVFKSEHLALGYLNNPAKTNEVFVTDPKTNDGRVYRTGDLGRRLPDGSIEFIGRRDFQVKVRGYRIESGEIEDKLLNHPDVKKVVVLVREAKNGNKYLCAYIVSENEINVAEVREYLAIELPDYMIPSHFVMLNELPLTSSGKVDRKALPEVDFINSGVEYIAPTNELEKNLTKIWSEVLDIAEEKIGVYHNFFELGGHSLKATQVITQIYKELNVKMPLAEFFKRPTINGLAEYIAEAENVNYLSIEKAEIKEFYPLSSAQKRMYILQQMSSENEFSRIGYNISAVTILEGDIDKNKLQETFMKLITRHESLRTSFEIIEGNPVQKIHDKVDFNIECHVSTETEIEDSKIVESFIRPFNLKIAPLFRVCLVKLSNSKHLLILDMHHIISDGTSMSIFVKEFMALYSGDDLPNLSLQYKDYAEWQFRKSGIEEIQRLESFWLTEFADEAEKGEVLSLNLPTSYKRPAIKSFEGSHCIFDIEDQGIKELSLTENVTTYMTLLAIWNIFLAKISSQEEIIVGTPVAGRSHPDLEGMIGMFVNTLAIKTSPQGEKRFADYLKEVKEKTIKVFENQDYQLEDLIEKLDLTRDLSRNPLFDVIFTLQNMDMPEVVVPGLKLKPYKQEKKISKFDLSLLGVEIGDRLNFTMEYCTKLFNQERIEQFINYFKRIVVAILQNPQVKISDIEIISEAEKQQILDEFNATTQEYPKDKTIQELFEENVQANPNQLALVFGEQQLTYLELNKKANQIARILREKGVNRDDIVTIIAKRTSQVFVCILAILKAGGAYLSVDSKYPEARKKYILEDSQSKLVLVQNNLFVENKDLLQAKEILVIEDIMNLTLDNSILQNINNPSDLAYIIYTSGTTGRPKGVMVTHRNVIRLVKNTNYFDLTKDDRVAQMGVLEFDASTFEIWGALLNGVELHIISKDIVLDFEKLERIFKQSKISTIFSTTALANQISETNIDVFAELKYLLVGGEALSPIHISRIRNKFPKLNILNGYGPTENTTFSTTLLIKEDYAERIPIGRPITNSTAYVVDKYNKLLPIGIIGELCVGGDGVARGYLNDSDLTKEKFIPNPFAEGEILYRTGDLARWLSDGTLDCLGRVDDQVKIRGFRIELGEIENKLVDYPLVKEAVVTVRKTENGDKYIAAYIVSNSEISYQELRAFLSEELPHYMVPSYIITLDKMPLTHNGKVNRSALPKPDEDVYIGTDYLPPTNEIEERLVELWRTILGVEKIGIRDNFFDLGGHSLRATTLMTKVHKEFSVEMPLQEIFLKPTIEQMSEYISKAACSLEEGKQYYNIPKVEEREYYPLSSMQKSLFIFNQKVDQTIAYNMSGVYIVNGKLEKERFAETIKKLARRHESLRTSFKFLHGQPVQIIHQDLDVEVQYLKAKESEVEDIIKEFIKPFNLAEAPLFRVGLLETEDKQILLYDMHHIISDGVSSTILVSDFAKLYQGKTLTDLRIQYKDYAIWQKDQQEIGFIKNQEEYWLKTFAKPVPPLTLPTDYQRPSVPTFEGDAVYFNLNQEITEKLEELAAKLGATTYMVLLAIYNIFLLKYANAEDVVIGTPIAGRVHEDLKEIIGVFINTLAMRNYPQKDKTFIEFVNEVKQNTLMAYDNQEYQYEMLLNALDIKPDLSRSPLYDVMFVYLNIDQVEDEMKDLKFTPYQFENTGAKYDITLYGQKNDNIINLIFRYRTQLFKKETIQKLSERFIKIAEEVTNNFEIKIADIEGVSKERKQEFLMSFNDDLEEEF
ncbi:MAG: amino acid adenylation domain-containing protein [Halanaerobiales bacterium]|nr:amino acid adenylation domain-containing protein [Halanaerobiales bacterium]